MALCLFPGEVWCGDEAIAAVKKVDGNRCPGVDRRWLSAAGYRLKAFQRSRQPINPFDPRNMILTAYMIEPLSRPYVFMLLPIFI
jgi:hypothetical protein